MSSGNRAPTSFAPLWFVLVTIICQAAAAGSALALSNYFEAPILFLCFALVAGMLAYLFSLPAIWVGVNAVAVPVSIGVLGFNLPGWIPLCIVMPLVLIHGPAFWMRVPYYPTHVEMYAKIADELPDSKNFNFIDLGCGVSGLLIYLAKGRPLGTYTGVEISILPYVISKLKALIFGRGKVKIRFKSIWSCSLGEFDYVYAFLSPAPMPRLWEKAKNEMKKGTIFITNSFPVGEIADKKIDIGREKSGTIYIHKIR